MKQHYLRDVPAVMNALLHTALAKKGTAVGVAAAREFLDRVLGKAPQPIVGEDGGSPVNVDAPKLVEQLRRFVEDGTSSPAVSANRPEA